MKKKSSTSSDAAKSAELRKLRAENKAMKAIVHRVYDVLYFETDLEDDNGKPLPDSFNPNKEWDSAADFMEMVADLLDTVIPRPEPNTTDYPELKVK